MRHPSEQPPSDAFSRSDAAPTLRSKGEGAHAGHDQGEAQPPHRSDGHGNSPDQDGDDVNPDAAVVAGAPAAPSNAKPASLPIVALITFLNSLGSGLLWSGVFFVTEQSFQWGEVRNFQLALGSTVVYAVAAFMSGSLVARMGRRISVRQIVAVLMVLQLLGGAAALFGPPGVITCALVASGASAMLWPIMESYLSAGRHGHALRRAIGIFNLTWMSAVGFALLLMAPAMAAGQATLGLLFFIPISGISLLLLPWLPKAPPPHGAPDAPAHLDPTGPAEPGGVAALAAQRMPEHRHRPEAERALRDATRVLLPVGYILIGALGPAMPFLLGGLEVEPGWRTPVTATWMAARLVMVALLLRFSFWHGRPSALVVGFLCAAGGFGMIALAGSLSTMLIGLTLFGAGQAIIYYAALYYAMAVGGAEVHAGSVFEALIGLGYGVGPIVGLIVGGAERSYVLGVLGISVILTALAFDKVLAARAARRSRAP
ncbi:MAG: MFS transporter [Phycisphaeraceae bacterium]|nr:MFS transporter [Phycisphaeraceae bacterium]